MAQAKMLGGISVVSVLVCAALGAPAMGAGSGVSLEPRAEPSPASTSGPNLPAERGLADVSVLTADDAWAVGTQRGADTSELALIRHWDGSRWSDVPAAIPASGDVELRGVTALSATSVWAVGSSDVGTSSEAPLVEHWDGTSWTNAGSADGILRLYTVAGSGPNDVWVGGDGYPSRTPVAEHWDGTAWRDTALALPRVPPDHRIGIVIVSAITVLSAKDVWAVGQYDDDESDGYVVQPLVEHWNGHRWRVRPLPQDVSTRLTDVSATGANDIWVVGQITGETSAPFKAHWNGQDWETWSEPRLGKCSTLQGVTEIAPDDVWAVGCQVRHALAEHWDGQQWSMDLGADPGRHHLAASLRAVDSIDSEHVFAVGQLANHDVHMRDVLAERWDGTSWRRQP